MLTSGAVQNGRLGIVRRLAAVVYEFSFVFLRDAYHRFSIHKQMLSTTSTQHDRCRIEKKPNADSEALSKALWLSQNAAVESAPLSFVHNVRFTPNLGKIYKYSRQRLFQQRVP
jgi:hypothetical protein